MLIGWRSLVSKFGIKQARGYRASLELSQAYQAVFHGTPDKEQQEMVLADLQAKSGWNRVTPPTASSDKLRHQEGKRELYGVIHGHLRLSGEDLRNLEHAARLEAVADDNLDFNS